MKFPLLAVASVASGFTLLDAGEYGYDFPFEPVKKVIGFMVGHEVSMLECLPYVQEVRPYLYEQLPFLKGLKEELKAIPNFHENRIAFNANLVTKYGEYVEIYPMHQEDHTERTDVDIILSVRPDAEIIALPLEDDEPPAYGNISWKDKGND